MIMALLNVDPDESQPSFLDADELWTMSGFKTIMIIAIDS